ncbi:rhodanese-like domain-containing protein [Flagellimonas myxillae]|uniref:rhodanese-like domain-containing protein n=1 Tax=Flagellimonas myxillae TaxID=2942214 RepID=UPI00201E991F|nr:rhodanese-like domain-containing protein [Muricauda myxillae]MCL6266956.1 rhodanese-like domain-containing protein [Muricauda myxillae]
MGKICTWIPSLLCCIFFFSCQSQQETTVKKIDKATLRAEAVDKKAQLVDVRTPGEYEKGHIGNAININVNGPNFQEQILKLDKQQPIYLYCKKGARSNKAVQLAKELGFLTIYDYSGGYNDWIRSK